MEFVFGFPQTHTRIQVFLCSLIDSVKWYTWSLYLNLSIHRHVLVFLLTRSFVFMGCLVNSSPIEIRGSLLNSGDPCSNHSERAYRCRPLTTLKQMVRQNVQTAFLRKSFGVMSIRLRIRASTFQWWNSPSITRCVHRRRIHRSS